ncbi:MAG: homoserine dehydrogenase, partial [Armatimonadetes bacterium]|nr:homoserine dehydrogenase [Armatimonadota bacterium]
MSQPVVSVGIVGFGVVGGGVYHILTKNGDEIARRTGAQIRVAKVADVDWQRERPAFPPPELRTRDAQEIVDDPDIPIVIETIGGVGAALDIVRAALEAG